MIKMTLRPSDIAIGDTNDLASTTLNTANLMAYGAATWDWARVHYDLPYAQKLSFPNVFVDGQTYGAILARQLIDWFGPRAFIRKMSLRYRSMVFAGETIRGFGEVIDLQPAGEYAIAAVSQVVQRGSDTVATCHTEVKLLF
ncbi:acyl dehydratase [Bradyrhizobium sp. i1.4.4]|uniref:MaoC/PaaZ C-terminal domain-containing protein n=1 Tax=unclassified Bradyrhizobium TaxID=2631580 RepID=UPI003392A973